MLVLAISLLGCGPRTVAPDTSLPWPAGLEALAPYAVQYPEGTEGDPYPERLATERSFDVDDPAIHGRGFIHAPLADVYAALKRPEVVADRREVASTTTVPDTRSGFDTSFRLQHVVEQIVRFEFAVDWWMSRVEDSPAGPFVVARSALVEENDFMYQLDVHVVLLAMSDDVTAIQIQRHTRSLSGNALEQAQWFVEDLYASLSASAKGQPLPTY